MDKIFYTSLLILCIFSSASLSGQDINKYDLTSSTATYTVLTSATQALENDSDWADLETGFGAEAGFTFDVLGTSSKGLLNFISANLLISDGFDYYNYESPIPFVFPSNLQFENRAQVAGNQPSVIQYKTEGDAGERIFKLEYSNVGFFVEQSALGTMDMFTNVQIWIYEGSNCIDYRYGPSNITDEELLYDGEPGFSAGLVAATTEQLGKNEYTYSIIVQGDPANPTAFEVENGDEDTPAVSLDGFPAEGMVYTFCPESIDVSTKHLIRAAEWNIFPNPVKDNLVIDFRKETNGQYEIFTIDGILMQQGYVNATQIKLDANSLAEGHYIAKVTTQDGFSVKRFFKATNNSY